MILRGRSAELRQLTDHCLAGHFAVLTSAPCFGVTTLIDAGLVPALREQGFIVVTFNEWQNRGFATQLKEAIANAARAQADESFFAQGESLEALLASVYSRTGRPVALILDQFEEYLRCHSVGELADAFDAELAHAVTSRKGQMVIALQDHAIPAFERLGHLIPSLLACRVQLPPLSRDAAREVMHDLAAARGIQFDDEVVESFVTARVVAAGQGVHPWLLVQAACGLLDATGKQKIPRAMKPALEILGGVERLVLGCFDAQLGELNTSQRDLLFRWCDVLVSPEGRRQSVTEKALTERGGKLSRFTPALLPILLGAGLLRSIGIAGVQRYELAREPLTLVLQDWWSREDSLLQAKRRARFRVRSMSIALGLVLVLYAVYLYLS